MKYHESVIWWLTVTLVTWPKESLFSLMHLNKYSFKDWGFFVANFTHPTFNFFGPQTSDWLSVMMMMMMMIFYSSLTKKSELLKEIFRCLWKCFLSFFGFKLFPLQPKRVMTSPLWRHHLQCSPLKRRRCKHANT